MKTFNKLIVVSATLMALLSTHAAAEGAMMGYDKSKCQLNNCPDSMGAKRSYHKNMQSNPIVSTIGYLELTNEQQKALNELKVSHRNEMRELRKERRRDGSQMEALINALSKDGVDKEALLAHANKKFQEREAKRVEHLSQVLAILTPEQRMELKKLLQNKMKNRLSLRK